jgi:hypothetical protein
MIFMSNLLARVAVLLAQAGRPELANDLRMFLLHENRHTGENSVTFACGSDQWWSAHIHARDVQQEEGAPSYRYEGSFYDPVDAAQVLAREIQRYFDRTDFQPS